MQRGIPPALYLPKQLVSQTQVTPVVKYLLKVGPVGIFLLRCLFSRTDRGCFTVRCPKLGKCTRLRLHHLATTKGVGEF